MIYTVQKAKLLSEQLQKFSKADSWIIVGQFVNLEFWLDEVKAAINTIDQHSIRFDKMHDSQKEWIESHSIKIPDNCPVCLGICELGTGSRKPHLPKRSIETKSDKKESRKELLDSAYAFLLQCYRLKLLKEEDLRVKCRDIGTSVDLADLEEPI